MHYKVERYGSIHYMEFQNDCRQSRDRCLRAKGLMGVNHVDPFVFTRYRSAGRHLNSCIRFPVGGAPGQPTWSTKLEGLP